MNIWFTLFHPFVVILLINLIACSILCSDLTTPFTAWLCHVKADWKCKKCEKCKNSREIGVIKLVVKKLVYKPHTTLHAGNM